MSKEIIEGKTQVYSGQEGDYLGIRRYGAPGNAFPVPLENGDAIDIFKDNARTVLLFSGVFETEIAHEVDARLVIDDNSILSYKALATLFNANLPMRIIRYPRLPAIEKQVRA